MATVQQLIDDANRVIAETQQGGNTQSRIGNLYLGIIDFIDILDRRTIDGYEYDDTALKEAIRRIDRAIEDLDRALDDALAIATQERDRLDNLVNELDQDIENKVNRMLDDASTLQDHASTIRQLVNEGEIYWKSEWDANIEAYLQEVGVWAREGDVIKTQWSEVKQDVSSIQSTVAEVQTDLEGRPTSTQWSQITQKVNSIEQSVNSLVNDGDVTEALQSSINQSIENGIAKLSLETVYAKKDVEGSEKLLEWMYAALKNSTTSTMTYAELVAAGESGLNNAIADVRTCVTTITNGDYLQYVSETSMETKVNDVVTGLYSKATASESSTNIFSQVKKDSTDISEIIVHCTGDYSDASIATKFANFKSGLVLHSDLNRATAELTAALEGEINGATAGLISEVELNSATSQVYAKMNEKFAGVIAKTDLESAFVEMVANSTDTTHGAVASIVAKVNDGGSSIKLTANTIEIDGVVTSIVANKIFTDYLAVDGNATFTGTINANRLNLGTGVTIPQANIVDLVPGLKSINDSIKGVQDDVTLKFGGLSEDIGDLNDALLLKLSKSDVTVSTQTTEKGITKRTINLGGADKTFTEIEGGDFIIHNIGRGDPDDTGADYFMVSTEGVLQAHNAIIYGTIYASAGRIAGWEIDTNVIKHKTDSVGLYSGSDYNPSYNDSAVRFWAGGYSRDAADFRVTKTGKLHATGADISGAIIATSIEIQNGTVTGNVDITGSFNIKSGSSTVLTIDGNSASTSATGDLTILDSQGLYIKRGNEGFRLTASGGFQRFNASQDTLVPFYASRCVKRINEQSYQIKASDDYILSASGNGALFLPPGVDGKVISIKTIGDVRIYPGTTSYGTRQLIITDHVISEDYQPLGSFERAEFVYYQGSWYWNKIGI